MISRLYRTLLAIPFLSPAASIWFQPLDQEVRLGQVATVNIEVRGPLNQQAFPLVDFYIDVIGAWNLQFGFDPDIVSFRSVEYNTQPFGDPSQNQSLISTLQPGAGRLDLALTSFLLPGELFDLQRGKGSYRLATVEFDTLKTGRTGLIWNTSVNQLSDAFGTGLVSLAARDNVNGSITVVDAAPTPEVPSLLAALGGFAFLVLMHRRRVALRAVAAAP